ncbi:MAG: hypothetical protein RLZZ387_233 [Chloroflexota bacterium]|jgi:hypothetical protein
MRQVLAALGALCLILVVGGSALLAGSAVGMRPFPKGATEVSLGGWRTQWGYSCQRTSYHMPADWSLLDQYAYLETHGMSRDRDADRSFQRTLVEARISTFAVFERRALMGLIFERATVAIAPSGHPMPQVSVDRCFRANLLLR